MNLGWVGFCKGREGKDTRKTIILREQMFMDTSVNYLSALAF